jgi:hypothetical protein
MRVGCASLALLVVSGCATITTGQNQPVSVETPGCAGATCKLSNDKGTWYVSATPGSATVQRAYGDMTVTCEKGDYRSNPYAIKSATKAMAFGNVIFGGLIGAAVDAGSGAAYDYPTLITVPIVCAGDPKTVVQPVPGPDAPAVAAAPGIAQPTASASVPVTVTTSAATHEEPAREVIRPVAAKSMSFSESKHMFAAEGLAKSLGCEQPATTMNIQTATSETFTVRCGSHEPLLIRCDGGECRELK